MSGEDALMNSLPVAVPPTAEQACKARKVVCANAENSAEAETLLKMLGLL